MKTGPRLVAAHKSEERAAWLFVLPQIIGYLLFAVLPVVFSLYLCFCEWDFYNPIRFVGFDNFRLLANDVLFPKSVVNTLLFVVITVPVTMLMSLLLALLCNRKIRGLSFYKSAFYLPMVTSTVAISMVFFWIFSPDFGLLVFVFDKLGLESPLWLDDPNWARVTILIMSVWLKMGYYFLIFLAGLKGISTTYYEAAEIDGANAWQKFRSITIPMLSPVTFFIFVTLTIGIFNMFNEPYILTEGGPVFSTYTLSMFIYDYSFKYLRLGPAAVASWALFILMGVTTFLQFYISERRVNYDV